MRFVAARPVLLPLLAFKELSTMFAGLIGVPVVTAGVGVYGPAANYALVWELGSRRLKSPGPKTLWSVNRNQERAILTQQAPFGYVTPTDDFESIIERELGKIDFSKPRNPREMALYIEVALENAAQRIAKIISQRAPVDSGDLRAGIQSMDSDEVDQLAEGEDLEASGTLIL